MYLSYHYQYLKMKYRPVNRYATADVSWTRTYVRAATYRMSLKNVGFKRDRDATRTLPPPSERNRQRTAHWGIAALCLVPPPYRKAKAGICRPISANDDGPRDAASRKMDHNALPAKYNYQATIVRRLIANCYTDRELSVITTYLNGNAQTPLGRFVVKQVWNKHSDKSNRWSL